MAWGVVQGAAGHHASNKDKRPVHGNTALAPVAVRLVFWMAAASVIVQIVTYPIGAKFATGNGVVYGLPAAGHGQRRQQEPDWLFG